ncbi:hypothetical protein RF55_10951 [Lasius niger]|uniref:Uncharacterized protein n=1 Tax=Lasius niger TaxID=67767 RepID=A0A0J7KG72_LASNI|nr:hypothetical protein RF55_10951 [Lasius niger]
MSKTEEAEFWKKCRLRKMLKEEEAAWRPFHAVFSFLVGRNANLSNVEKMHYLQTNLMGKAAQLISNLPVSEDSSASAWDLLVNRYENKRLLISDQVERLFRIKTFSERLSKEINAILNTTTEVLNALQSLGASIHYWDHLLVHLIAQRLDSSTREAWEVKLGSTTDPPLYQDIRNFLTGRARALESMELGRHNAVACQNKKRCRKSGNKHHTMIHMEGPRHISTPMEGKPTPTTTATQTSVPASPKKSITSSASD